VDAWTKDGLVSIPYGLAANLPRRQQDKPAINSHRWTSQAANNGLDNLLAGDVHIRRGMSSGRKIAWHTEAVAHDAEAAVRALATDGDVGLDVVHGRIR